MTERVIVSLCDLTGNALRPWAEAGWTCYAVDTAHSIRNPREERIGDGRIIYVWGDVRSWVPPRPVAFGMAWTPCTHVAGSGGRDWQTKGMRMLTDALDLFNAAHHALSWSGAPFVMENPAGALTRHFRHPDYTFDPCEYAGYADDPDAEAYTKRTCLWTGNGFIMPKFKPVHPIRGSMMHLLPPGDDRADVRAATPSGFARAVFQANANVVRQGRLFEQEASA